MIEGIARQSTDEIAIENATQNWIKTKNFNHKMPTVELNGASNKHERKKSVRCLTVCMNLLWAGPLRIAAHISEANTAYPTVSVDLW